MRLTLTPNGLEPAALGMTRTEVAEILKTWGEPEAFSRGAVEAPGWMVVLPEVSIFTYCDHSGRVSAIELSRPDDPGTTVEFDRIDLFGAPADSVLSELERRGHEVVVTENGYSATVPDVLLAMWRSSGPTDPKTNLPLLFESVLVARPGYDG